MALNRLTILLAAEVAERGIRLNAVCPGPIMSDRVIDERVIDPITAEHRTPSSRWDSLGTMASCPRLSRSCKAISRNIA